MYHIKRICSLAVAVLMLVLCIVPASAVEQSVTEGTVYYEDGSYTVTTLVVEPSFARASGTKTGSKTVTGYNASNVKLYSYTVRGTFSYNGSSATATAVSTTSSIHMNGWVCTNTEKSKSGNSVTGTGTFKCGLLTRTATATITCSATGVLS